MKTHKSEIINHSLGIFLSLFGIYTLIRISSTPSEAESAFLFGFSKIRLAILLITLIILLMILIVTVENAWKLKCLQNTFHKISRLLQSPTKTFIIFTSGFITLLVLIGFFVLANSMAARELVILETIQERAGLLLIWIGLIILAGFFLWYLNTPPQDRSIFTPFRIAILYSILILAYFVVIKIFALYTWDIRFRGLENFLFLTPVLFLVWAYFQQKFSKATWYQRVENLFISLMILFAVFTIYRHTSQWMDWRFTPSKAYWNLLADAFLHGRLYLINPTFTHDLTLYDGNWYVPNPPLPAIILMPFVALLGLENLNMVVFSIWCGAITVLLIFWLLQMGSSKGLFQTSRAGNLWLTAVFAMGTCFWWLSIMGRVWFISQILTVLFTAVAAILVLNKRSPVLVGLALGLAIMCRPNVFTVWPFLLGIYIYLENTPFPKIPWRKVILWSVQSAIPICLAVAGLLYYNYIRFDDFMDFGYVTISSSDWIMDAVQTYGMFHPHFFQSNFLMMFINHPAFIVENGCFRFSASMDGYSLLAMTPVLIYIFRRIKLNWWVVASWIAVLFTVGLLLFYHNNGAAQLGYRYLMDFIVPILFLLALGIGTKPSWLFKALVIISILGNLFGIMWWFQKWWC